MASMTDYAGLPAVPPGQVTIDDLGNGNFRLNIGRRTKTKRVWMTHAEATTAVAVLTRALAAANGSAPKGRTEAKALAASAQKPKSR